MTLLHSRPAGLSLNKVKTLPLMVVLVCGAAVRQSFRPGLQQWRAVSHRSGVGQRSDLSWVSSEGGDAGSVQAPVPASGGLLQSLVVHGSEMPHSSLCPLLPMPFFLSPSVPKCTFLIRTVGLSSRLRVSRPLGSESTRFQHDLILTDYIHDDLVSKQAASLSSRGQDVTV